MDFEFRNDKLERLYYEYDGGLGGFPAGVAKAFFRVMDTIDSAPDERVFRGLGGLHYEKLQGKRSHQRSMRLNKKYRLIIEVKEGQHEKKIIVVGIEDYH
ncbi:MAG: type II toxin-antitoxin system RelE/ParE family toxin [Planctomycetes bacterium]|nr:type II toxin-antitoxin system RelE/ParE family toxin [Planctomycetota bacterium]